jgi:hypothetical protein
MESRLTRLQECIEATYRGIDSPLNNGFNRTTRQVGNHFDICVSDLQRVVIILEHST